MAIALAIPLLKPMPAITIDQETTVPVFNWIDNLQPGDIASETLHLAGQGAGPQVQAWFRHCMLKGVKVVMVAQWNTGERLGYTH